MNGLLDNWILACQEIGMALQRSSLALQSNAPYIDTTLKQQSLKHKKEGTTKDIQEIKNVSPQNSMNDLEIILSQMEN